jgi:hypothetical protein
MYCGVSDRRHDNGKNFVKLFLCKVRPQLRVERIPTSATPRLSVYGTNRAMLPSNSEIASIRTSFLRKPNSHQI